MDTAHVASSSCVAPQFDQFISMGLKQMKEMALARGNQPGARAIQKPPRFAPACGAGIPMSRRSISMDAIEVLSTRFGA